MEQGQRGRGAFSTALLACAARCLTGLSSVFTTCQWGQGLPWVAQMVKNLSAMQETWVRSLGREDPLETEMATHSSILAWRIPGTEELGGLQSMGSQRAGHNLVTKQQQGL